MSDLQLISAAQAGDRRAEEKLCERWRYLALRCASDFFTRTGDDDDMRQEALLGLLSAIRSYRPEKGSTFPSFLWLCVHRRLWTVLKLQAARKHEILTDATRAAYNEDGERLEILELVGSIPLEREVLGREEIREIIRDLDGMTVSERRALVGLAIGCSYEECGDPKKVDNALQRARHKIRRRREAQAMVAA